MIFGCSHSPSFFSPGAVVWTLSSLSVTIPSVWKQMIAPGSVRAADMSMRCVPAVMAAAIHGDA
jgi:hypothetical protein